MAEKTAKNAMVSDEFAKKFATEKETPYTRWIKSEGLDLISSTYVQNLHTVELKPWARRGGSGVFMNHEASRTSNDCYVCEIPAGKKLEPQRQLFEEMVLVLSGRGSTTVWNNAGKRITFEWKEGALFGIPLNCWHQHFNGSGREGARFGAAPRHQHVPRQVLGVGAGADRGLRDLVMRALVGEPFLRQAQPDDVEDFGHALARLGNAAHATSCQRSSICLNVGLDSQHAQFRERQVRTRIDVVEIDLIGQHTTNLVCRRHTDLITHQDRVIAH